MNRPLFSELSIAEKIALLTECAERYAELGAVPDFIFRAEMAAALRGPPEERLELLFKWHVPFFSGWAGLSSETVAKDLNDPSYFQEDELAESDCDQIDLVLDKWFSLNDETFRKELEKREQSSAKSQPG